MKKIWILLLAIFVCVGCTDKKAVVDEKVKDQEPLYTGVFKDNMKEAVRDLDKMSLEEKIGQLFIIRFDENSIENDLNNIVPSGYVLFAKDVENDTKESLSARLSDYQNRSKTKLIFAVDEEGGFVTRISRFPNFRSEKFKSVRDYYLEGGIDKLLEIEEEKDNLLKSLGINLNLAPVADVSVNTADFIYNRTLGESADIVKDYISKIVNKANSLDFAVTLKHFPGYGENVDTHTGISLDQRSQEDLANNSLPPFVAGIKEGVPVIMISHNIVESYDKDNPASLSEAIHELLRNQGFTGLIVTDDLDMEAIQEVLGEENEAVRAFIAGNDLIMTSKFDEDRKAMIDAVNNKQISEEEINARVSRILAFKYQYNIIS